MRKYYISLALILTIWFLYLDREEPLKDTYIEPKKKKQNITKEQNLIEVVKISTPLPIKEENKTKQQEEVGELKYCLDELIEFNRRGEKKRILYDYHGDILEIKVDKNLDGKIDFSNHREFNENGDLLLEERDFDNDGEIDTKTDYLYNSWDRLEEVEIKAYMKSREEPVVLKVNINYSDEEEIDDSKVGKSDENPSQD